jgi:hypothetical protein
LAPVGVAKNVARAVAIGLKLAAAAVMSALAAVTQALSRAPSLPPGVASNWAALRAAPWAVRPLRIVVVVGGSARPEAVVVERVAARAAGVGEEAKNDVSADVAAVTLA